MADTEKLMAVVKHIIQANGEISAAKLQKLVYYCQAYALAWDGAPLFDNRVEAWIHGPIVPDLYKLHEYDYLLPPNYFDGKAAATLIDDEIETIDAVLDGIGGKDGQWMSDLSHTEAPWIDARKGINENTRGNSEITVAAMKTYYSSFA